MMIYKSTQAPKFRAALEARAAELRGVLAHEADAARADAPREVGGFADAAAQSAASEVDENHAAHAAKELLDIDAALRRLDEGSYGQCIDCGDPIDLRRLIALPAASHCTACQAVHER